jgi:N-acetylmuramoyl-L-alanine amidase
MIIIIKNFSKKQIESLKKLSQFLIKKYKINQKNILGHSDIAPD